MVREVLFIGGGGGFFLEKIRGRRLFFRIKNGAETYSGKIFPELGLGTRYILNGPFLFNHIVKG